MSKAQVSGATPLYRLATNTWHLPPTNMTTATQLHEVLDVELDTDQLVDIVNHGMAQGVSGFIYHHELKAIFDLHEEEIMSTLNCYCYDIDGSTAIEYLSDVNKYGDIQDLTNDLVWMYVETKAHEILMDLKHPSVY